MRQLIQYAKGKSDTVAKLDGTFKLPEKALPAIEAPEETSAQRAIFGSAPMKALPMNEARDGAKGVKRGRDEEQEREQEEEEEDDEGAEMQMSESDEE